MTLQCGDTSTDDEDYVDDNDDDDDDDNQVSGAEEELPVWRHLYSTSTDLGLKGIAPQDWIEVLETQKLLHCGDRLWQNGSIWTFHIFTFHISTSLHCVMEVLDRATKDDLLFEQMVRFYNQNRFFSSTFFG